MPNRPCIMVVDDDPNVVRFIKRVLETEKFGVVPAGNGLEALKLLDSYEIDLMILDLKMPGMDGFQTITKLRERSELPVIMLTAQLGVESLEKGIGLGADDYINKPVNMSVLVARIRAKLRRVKGERS